MMRNPSSNRGFGLIEIMVALTLGLVILLGVTEVFTNNSRTRAEIERTGQQIESAAYALRVIENDIANAAFWGEAAAQPALVPLPPVCPGLGADLTAAANQLRRAMGYPVQGEEGDPSGNCVSPKAGTEYLAVRRASSCALGETGCEPANGNFHLQVNACFLPDVPGSPIPGDLEISSTVADLDYQTRACDSSILAPRYRFVSRVYFVNDDDQLVRAQLEGNGASDYDEVALVEGVEMLRFEYGQDTDGDSQVDDPNDPVGAEWSDVVMVRVFLVVRNLEPTAGYEDTKTYSVGGEAYTVPGAFSDHKRQVYSRTVSLRNVAGRREEG